MPSASQGCGDALLAAENVAQRGPAGALAGGGEAAADDLHGLAGDDGDEQVSLGADRLAVVDGPQAEFGLQRPEHGLEVGQGGAGAPQRRVVPVGDVGAQAADAGVGGHGGLGGTPGPVHRRRALAGVVGDDLDVAVAGDAAVARLEAADALVHLVEALDRARPGKSLGERAEGLLEALREAFQDGVLLLRPLRRVAVQAHLAVGAHRGPLQMHGASAAGDARRRRRGVERAPALAARRQAAVSGLAQPRHPALGGDAAVHRRQRPGRRAERGQHGLERVLLADAAGEHPRAAREAAAVERQPEGEQRAVAALLLGVARAAFGSFAAAPSKQVLARVVQGHRRGDPEQLRRGVEQVLLDRRAVRHEGVRGAAGLHGAHGLEVDAEQLAGGAALAQPAHRRALRGRLRHARDDRAERRVAQRGVDAERLQQGRQAEFAGRPQRGVLDADGARPRQRQAVDGDRLDAAGGVRRRRAAGEQLRGDALRLRLHGLRGLREELDAAVEDLFDALARQRPEFAVDVEVAAEVEQRSLADAVAVAFGADQAVGVADGAAVGGAGSGASDEHGGTMAATEARRKECG